jgi:hypothetical protein
VEPVIYPTAIVPVAHPDRIKRPEPRRDNGKESAFARYLRRRQGDADAHESPADAEPPPSPAHAAETRESSGGANATQEPADQGASKKLIDVRV